MIDFGNISVGEELAPIESEPITLEWLKKYADLSGDHSLIHLNKQSARHSGFPDIITHGMLSMGIGSRLISSWLDPTVKETTFNIRFISPLYLGEKLLITGNIIEMNEIPPSIHISVIGKNTSERIIFKGEFKLTK